MLVRSQCPAATSCNRLPALCLLPAGIGLVPSMFHQGFAAVFFVNWAGELYWTQGLNRAFRLRQYPPWLLR
jgi:hypothetical protein